MKPADVCIAVFVAQVAPFALPVPFVGSAASKIVFGEKFGPLRLAGMVIVVGGIAVLLLSKRPRIEPETVSEKIT
jgi:O-acetylserine/cysteine efflux transporter